MTHATVDAAVTAIDALNCASSIDTAATVAVDALSTTAATAAVVTAAPARTTTNTEQLVDEGRATRRCRRSTCRRR